MVSYEAHLSFNGISTVAMIMRNFLVAQRTRRAGCGSQRRRSHQQVSWVAFSEPLGEASAESLACFSCREYEGLA